MSLTLKTTLGDVKIELFTDLVPRNTENFLTLCASGLYNDTQFHRSIPKFMVQGGDPTGTGKGGECIWGGFVPGETTPSLSHNTRGLVSMCNMAQGSCGSQFFFTYAPAPHLDGECTIIGKIIGGEDTLARMEAAPVAGKKSRPEQPITLLGVKIHANPFV